MRNYDPTTGRYIQSDPLGLVDGVSVYGYAKENPGRWVDPRGEQSSDALGPMLEPLLPRIGAICVAAIESGASTVLGLAGAIVVATATPTSGDDVCPCGDKCTPITANIFRYLNEIKQRFGEYDLDALGLPENGPYPPGSRSGHRVAIRNWQAGLRKLIMQAESMGCPIPADAWYWATREIY